VPDDGIGILASVTAQYGRRDYCALWTPEIRSPQRAILAALAVMPVLWPYVPDGSVDRMGTAVGYRYVPVGAVVRGGDLAAPADGVHGPKSTVLTKPTVLMGQSIT
jgi:hypothetical protein